MSNVIKVKTGLVSLLLILIYATTPTLADDNQGSIIVDEIVEWTTDQDLDAEARKDAKLKKTEAAAEDEGVCIPIGEGENCW